MSYGCMFVLRDVGNIQKLKYTLNQFAKSNAFGLVFDPQNNLLNFQVVHLASSDVVFEISDSFNSSSAELLLSRENYMINGEISTVPLSCRMRLIQHVACICLMFSSSIEIFFGEDNPYLLDYISILLKPAEIAEYLHNQYKIDDASPFLPCLHLKVRS